MVKLNQNMQALVAILIFIMLADSGVSAFSFLTLSSSSYSTGYQGARAQYSGVQFKGQQFTGADKGNASRARFDTTLSFDADAGSTGLPNLEGEMSSVFVPSESLSNLPAFIPTEWQRNIAYITNPKNSWEWEIGNSSYVMEEWILRWYFSISAEWDEPFSFYAVAPEQNREWYDKTYSDAEIWFEIDLTPVWYFEGADRAYFAIAKLQLADVRLSAHDNQGNEVDADKSLSVKPQSQGSILPVYYSQFAKSSGADKTTSSYQGKKLNPDLFTSTVHTYFSLEHFGTHQWIEWTPFPDRRYKGDVVTVAVDVHAFVIGEWDVKDVQSIQQVEGEEGFGRTAKVGGAGFSIGDWFALPESRLLLALLAGAGILLAIAIFAPAVLITIFACLTGLFKKREFVAHLGLSGKYTGYVATETESPVILAGSLS